MRDCHLRADLVDDCGLSPKVREVAVLLAVGMSKPEIAKRLYRSTETIKDRTEVLLAEMDAHTVGEAVAKLVAEGKLTIRYAAGRLGVALFWLALAAQAVEFDHGGAMRQRTRNGWRVDVAARYVARGAREA